MKLTQVIVIIFSIQVFSSVIGQRQKIGALTSICLAAIIIMIVLYICGIRSCVAIDYRPS